MFADSMVDTSRPRVASGGRVPPHDVEAERAVLGAILLDSEALREVLELLLAEDFYSKSNALIYSAIKDLSGEGTEVDIVSIGQKLKLDKILDTVGGHSYIAGLTESVLSGANASYFANIIKDFSVRRQLLRISAKISTDSYDTTSECRDVIDNAEGALFQITNSTVSPPQLAQKIALDTFNAIERRATNKEAIQGVSTGFNGLDEILGGFHPSEFIVIGARPSVGKTALTISMISSITIHNHVPTVFFSLEMTSMTIMQRLLSKEARIDATKIRKGTLRTADLTTLRDAIEPIYSSQFWIIDTPHLQMFDLRTLSRRLVRDHQVRIIFIDYLTLITADSLDLPRHEQVASISRSLKAMAHELDIPVVVLSQVTRDTEGRRPTLATIRESGSIEQDADVVIFLHREETNYDDDQHQDAIPVKVIVAKQRNGPVGSVELQFIPRFVSFEQTSVEYFS